MKKLLILLVAVVLLTACKATDKDACLQVVKDRFPKAEIYVRPNGSCFNFVVIDSLFIYHVQTDGFFKARIDAVDILVRKQ
jgi:hypothetical protein